jgi:predicted LPLAT superfamily acyltransferase
MSVLRAPPSEPGAATPRAAEWRRTPERGSSGSLRAMAWLSLRLGRRAGRVVLYGIAVYFFLFAPRARKSMRAYLARALGRQPGARDRFRQVLYFATAIHDRLYLLAERFELFRVTEQGEELMREVVATGHGALLMGAHMGSFEVLRWIGVRQPGLAVTMAMYEDNARKLNAILGTLAPAHPPDIVAIGHLDAMLHIRARLERGALVGILADRRFGSEAVQAVSFLGETAYLPTGPMRAAAMLRRRVVFMLGLYRGGNRYHVVFEPLADFSLTPPGQRQSAVAAAIARYAALLEQHCRNDPYNWFNFFDFWRSDAEARSIANGTPRG